MLSAAFAFLALLVSCGDDDVSPEFSPDLSVDEQAYADQIAAAQGANVFLTPGELKCVGQQSVKTFGLARAKELDLASRDTPALVQADAEKLADVIDYCVGLSGFVLRSAQSNLGLGTAQVEICASLMDKTKVRPLVLAALTHKVNKSAEEAAVQAEVTTVLARCRPR